MWMGGLYLAKIMDRVLMQGKLNSGLNLQKLCRFAKITGGILMKCIQIGSLVLAASTGYNWLERFLNDKVPETLKSAAYRNYKILFSMSRPW